MDKETDLVLMAKSLGETALLGLLAQQLGAEADDLIAELSRVEWDQLTPQKAAAALGLIRQTSKGVARLEKEKGARS